MIGTALAEPKIVSLRHFVSEHRRERSDTLLIAKGEAGGIDEGSPFRETEPEPPLSEHMAPVGGGVPGVRSERPTTARGPP